MATKRTVRCIKIDLNLYGPFEATRGALTPEQEYDAFRELHESAFMTNEIIVFSEVRGPLAGLMRLAANHKYLSFRTNPDAQNFAMMVFWSPEIDVPLRIGETKIDLRWVYEELRTEQQNQRDKNAEWAEIRVHDTIFKIDLRQFDFSTVPPVRHGVHVEKARVYQYVPPGPPTPATRASMLAKLLFHDAAVEHAVAGGYAYIGDANLPSDSAIITADGVNVFESVLKLHERHATRLNDGETIRLTLFDILGRRKLGIPGWKLEIDDQAEYLHASQEYRSEFDFAHNCPTAAAHFGPEAPLANFEELLWDPVYVQAVSDARQRDAPRQYTEINKIWTSLPQYLLDRGIPFDLLVALIFQEDHVRVTWMMSLS